METFMTQLFDSWKELYAIFGIWSLALAVVTFLLMIPANIGIKKLFALGKASEVKERARKTLSAILVFIIAGLAIAFFVGVIKKTHITFEIVYQGAIPCGIIAKLIHWLWKLIKELGFDVVLIAIAQTRKVQTYIKGFGVDSITYQICLDYVKKNFGKEFDYTSIDNDAQYKATKIAELETKLKGFVKEPKVIATKLIDYILNGNEEGNLE